ncbi:HWE histidine kinase domain-containing protein [Croceicoccus gelatinilyticus]|uniref:HWE histidine kinase domain-containing protein n=1 Tax=Croceicoccus gelatinilyticus TaxID=2835536 RepID=UPI001BCEDEFC|nr:HWE histidine kinase domain-containing protein [Croceicoccus gelatinilyticus]MBS7669772.1 sensor histidine kinase [Croceicoccus gelatinilyticus]
MEIFEGLRSDALSRVAHGDPSSEILADIANHFMDRFPHTTAGVTAIDRTTLAFEPGIFPTLSPAFGDALAGIKVADKPGSCARAVADGEIIDVPHVPSDERFAQAWRDMCVKFGITAMTSFPAPQRDGTVLGTFVVVYDPQSPLDYQTRRLAEKYAQLCGFILAYRRREDGQELIVGELQHRTRNLINTIGALVYSTLKANPDMERFRKVLDGRLSAMARAHSLALSPGNTDLRQLLVDTLAPYSIDHQLNFEGPKLLLSEQSAVAFCLATHELATNAVKYGSLSRSGGRIDVTWAYDPEAEGDFRFDWVESGGPQVVAPTRQGFGQRTIHAGLASAFDAKVEVDYPEEGFRMSLSAPRSLRLGSSVN